METNKQNYKKETAGFVMDQNIPIVNSGSTLHELRDYLIENALKFHSVSYIYIVGENNKLVGVLSIKEVFSNNLDREVDGLMGKNLITTSPDTDQEEVALISLRKNIKAVPVVDRDGILLGAVLKDTLLHVLYKESVEDALLHSGIRKIENPNDILEAGAWLHFKKRFPWLLLGLFGGILAAFIVKLFEESLAMQIILASFIPAIVYMADAVGSQTQTIFIRSIALSKEINLKKYILREVRVAFLLSSILGLISFLITIFWIKSLQISLIVSLSIIATISVSMAVGIILPYTLSKLKIDPAIASGPSATVLRDILNLLIYFGIISVLLF